MVRKINLRGEINAMQGSEEVTVKQSAGKQWELVRHMEGGAPGRENSKYRGYRRQERGLCFQYFNSLLFSEPCRSRGG